jgi:hypothetical protein
MATARIHVFVFMFLIFVFLGLIIIASSNKQVDIEYIFEENVILDSIPDFTASQIVEIGRVKLENNGLIPSKINLNNYVLCSNNPYFRDGSYNVVYRPIFDDKTYEFLFSYYDTYSLELLSGEKIELIMSPQIYLSDFKFNFNESVLNQAYVFYIFEVPETASRWNYCERVGIDGALSQINLTFNISRVNIGNDLLRQ